MTTNGHMMPDGSPMAGPPMPNGAPPAPSFDPSDITELVDTHERDFEPLRERMQADYNRYRLVSHVNRDAVSGEPLLNYATYTSNMPKVYADKVISWLTASELLIRAPHVEAGQHPEEADNLKERLAIGSIRAADERLKRLRQPSIRGQQAFYTTVRGGYIGGRCLLVNRPDGTVYPDINAWDPLHIRWGLGDDGLAWACYKVKKTRAQIQSEYGVSLGETGPRRFFGRLFGNQPKSVDAEKEGVWTYDFYDGQVNVVVAGKEVLKAPTPHGSPRVPVYLVLVGSNPVLQSESQAGLIADVGESVYGPLREVYEKNNDILSIMLEIVARARRQTVVLESRDGKKTLPDDPFKSGTEISMATGERVYSLELQKMAQETAGYMTMVAGEIQRASLPYSSYGETPFQLSGFAITQLRQATETVLSGRLLAMEEMYMQVANLIHDQFQTGAFDGMRLSGIDSSRQYFNQQMTPDLVRNTCDYTVKMVSQLPQDDLSKWSTAKIAKELTILADEDILNDILGVQDSKQTQDKLKTQQSKQGLPEAVLFTLGQAAAARGDMVVANMYLMEFQRLMAQKMGMMPPDGQQGGPAEPKKSGGLQPEVQPNAMTGAAPEPETSNDGPSYVAPGTPRNTQERTS